MLYFDDNLNLAHILAKKMHYGQTYRSDNPNSFYNNHIVPVATMVMYYAPATHAESSPVRVAAVLHDIVEDTPLTDYIVNTIFGNEVAKLVWAVTDEPGANRKEKKLATYPKIAGNKNATLIKLCDRYINTKGSDKLYMYWKEFPEFKQHLYVPGMWDDLWLILEEATREKENDHNPK